MDVYPDGRHMLVVDGILRMRYREGRDQEVFMTPGTDYEVEIDLWSTALVFNTGHRIAVAVSSSNHPRFDVNSNTGGRLPATGSIMGKVAQQELHQDWLRPSRIILPVVSYRK